MQNFRTVLGFRDDSNCRIAQLAYIPRPKGCSILVTRKWLRPALELAHFITYPTFRTYASSIADAGTGLSRVQPRATEAPRTKFFIGGPL
jgi:hypothetical protein